MSFDVGLCDGDDVGEDVVGDLLGVVLIEALQVSLGQPSLVIRTFLMRSKKKHPSFRSVFVGFIVEF